jgi:hypothetical protein
VCGWLSGDLDRWRQSRAEDMSALRSSVANHERGVSEIKIPRGKENILLSIPRLGALGFADS